MLGVYVFVCIYDFLHLASLESVENNLFFFFFSFLCRLCLYNNLCREELLCGLCSPLLQTQLQLCWLCFRLCFLSFDGDDETIWSNTLRHWQSSWVSYTPFIGSSRPLRFWRNQFPFFFASFFSNKWMYSSISFSKARFFLVLQFVGFIFAFKKFHKDTSDGGLFHHSSVYNQILFYR